MLENANMYHYLSVTCKNIVLINVQNCNFSDIWSNVLNNISNNKTKYHVLRGKGHLFALTLETGRQAKLWRAFLSRFAASTNQFIFPTMYIYYAYPLM